jgi:GNAT superfamily N-acetyltransferase
MIEIAPSDLSPAGLAGLAALLRRRFPRAVQITPAYLAWTYLRNPEGAALAFDAREGGRLVAHFAATPLRARIGGAIERGRLTQHAATEPGFEGRGLFQALVRRALAEGAATGFGHALAFANAQSRFAFIERLGFRDLCRLDVRVGVGPTPEPTGSSPASWERLWDAPGLAWRLARPDLPYRARVRGALARVYCASGYPGIDAEVARIALALLPPGVPTAPRAAPLRVWIGLDRDLSWRGRAYLPLPRRLRPAPLHFAFRDLRAAERAPQPAALRVQALDFDAY